VTLLKILGTMQLWSVRQR